MSLSIFCIYCHAVEYMQKTKNKDKAKAFIGRVKIFCQSCLGSVVILVTHTPLFWLSILWMVCVPNECFSSNTSSALTLISTFYSRSDIEIHYIIPNLVFMLITFIQMSLTKRYHRNWKRRPFVTFSNSPLWTIHFYVATLKQHLHIEYFSVDATLQSLRLIESCC